MVVYSVGMTLYWCVDYHLPQNQVPFSLLHPLLILAYICSTCTSSMLLSLVCPKPVQLSAQLEGLLLSMCEDVVVRRTDLMTVQDTCEIHHRAAMLPPPERLVRQLVEDIYRNSVSVWMMFVWFQMLRWS